MFKLVAVSLMIAGGLFAQDHVPGRDKSGPPRGPRPWWDSNVAKNANLSDAQQKQFTQILADFRPRMIETRRAVNKADAEVTAAFNEDTVDQAKANAAIEKLAAANAEATRTVSQLDLKLRSILTAEQWASMHLYQRTWPGQGPGRRRGPPTSTSTSTATNQQK
jgi:Spy/CpxP family protein refolding chaperone